MPPIPTRPRKRRAQGGLTFQRGGVVLPLPDAVRDQITPAVWRRRRGQRGGLLFPLPPQLRGKVGTPLGLTSAWLSKMARPKTKKKRGQRGGLLFPLPSQLRGKVGTPVGLTSAWLSKMARPKTKKKKRRTRRL